MPTRLFEKEDLKDVLFGETDNLTLIYDNITDTSRWSEHHEIVFQDDNTKKFYMVGYSCGLTEYQDESPFDNERDEIECVEVEPKPVEVIKYVPVTN